PPNPINPPTGCRFHPRCPQAAAVCAERVPTISDVQLHHHARCLVHEFSSGHPLATADQPALAA
ncbi:oligopeptide/dipeptide ABC transporter ATP-binding protein, partial [Comamonas aquatica]